MHEQPGSNDPLFPLFHTLQTGVCGVVTCGHDACTVSFILCWWPGAS